MYRKVRPLVTRGKGEKGNKKRGVGGRGSRKSIFSLSKRGNFGMMVLKGTERE